jgi:hypothetical protein
VIPLFLPHSHGGVGDPRRAVPQNLECEKNVMILMISTTLDDLPGNSMILRVRQGHQVMTLGNENVNNVLTEKVNRRCRPVKFVAMTKTHQEPGIKSSGNPLAYRNV